jgi:hypothetical protein
VLHCGHSRRFHRFHCEASLAYDGVRLFVECARLLRPGFSVTSGNAASLASICYRLDGIPLAIELAAPRLRSISVEELSQGLDQRFALLTNNSRTALPRHRTLRSTIDWRYASVDSLCHRAPTGNLFLRVNARRARIALTVRTRCSTFSDDERCGSTLRILFNIKRRGLVARFGAHSRQGRHYDSVGKHEGAQPERSKSDR